MSISTIKVLQDYIFTSKYARWIKEKNRRETWNEAVDRVRNMMHQKYAGLGIENEIDWSYDMMLKKRVLGSQRALQYGGSPILNKNVRCYNCVASHLDRPRFFQEYLWLLLAGCGAGFSVQKHHVAKLPDINDPSGKPKKIYSIPDTIEGWADALGILLTTYFEVPSDPQFSEWVNYQVEFDYSLIRPKGSELSSGVGKAPGPDGLRHALENINKLLIFSSAQHGKLRPIDAFDICMFASDAVLSGGVRRSATLALFSHDDIEMIQSKTGDWWVKNPQRQRANISASLIRNTTNFHDFKSIIESVKQFGEPGFYWTDSNEMVPNPCCEISFFPYDIINEDKFQEWKLNHGQEPIISNPEEIGLNSGWQGCNLSTSNCSKLQGDTKQDKTEYFLENIKAAAIIGTLQAGFTDLTYLGKTSENIFKRESLLGVSMTGMMDNPDIVLDKEVQEAGAKLTLDTNNEVAKKIGINPCARGTCLKPEGTGSLILGVLANGIHAHHYTRYLRTVQANKEEVVYQHFKNHNASACEQSLSSATNTDDVIYFPIEVPDGAKTKNQLPALEMLEIVKNTQVNWVMNGRNKDLCVMPWIQNNVSNTVVVNDNEWDDVTQYIYDNKQYFTGITLLGISGDKDYPQAPFCAVYTSRQIVKEYGEAALWTSGLIELALQAFNGHLYTACLAVMNSNYPTKYPESICDTEGLEKARQITFVIKARKFADKYFGGDYKKLTYCIKDVYNWKRWYDLKESFAIVDYTSLVENEDNTKILEEVSCAGGTCSIV